MFIKNHKWIIIILAIFLFFKIITLQFYNSIWWDSSVYVGMAKYIYSSGSAGLWENSRPLVWPIILGFFWKLGLNIIFYGRLMEILFASMCIFLTYLIGTELYGKKSALLASAFLSVSSIFFFFSGIMLTEIVSTFFALAGVYYLIREKYFISGIFLGIAFMTRFLQMFVFFAAFALVLYNKKRIKHIMSLSLGFLVPAAPYLVFNQVYYGNAIFPTLQQLFLSQNSGWQNYHSLSYYFIGLFRENFLYLLALPGAVFALRNHKNNSKSIPVIFLAIFIFFNSIRQKELRFLIILLPYMHLLAAYFIFCIAEKYGNALKEIIVALVILSAAFSAFNLVNMYRNELGKTNPYANLQDKYSSINPAGEIWVSNPIISVKKDDKIGEMMYYPVFDRQKASELAKESKNADFIFMDSCDLACGPGDYTCENDKLELIKNFRKVLNIAYSSKTKECEQYIFSKKLISLS